MANRYFKFDDGYFHAKKTDGHVAEGVGFNTEKTEHSTMVELYSSTYLENRLSQVPEITEEEYDRAKFKVKEEIKKLLK